MADKTHIVVITQDDGKYRVECRDDLCQWMSELFATAHTAFRVAVYHQYKKRGISFRLV